ncbi:MAG: pyridoxal-dependent decarboxylase [Planctomycetota bacterium]|nr:pyridoxal-dependent decarboxylase [Planctomycetota bacterium]
MSPLRDSDPIAVAAEIARALPHRMRELAPAVQPPAAEVRAHLAAEWDLGVARPAQEVVRATAALLERWSTHVVHPRYYGFFNPSVTPESVAGDLLAAAFNPQLAAWTHAPAACEIERHLLRALGAAIGFGAPDDFLAHFTSGGAEANHSALLIALTHRFEGYDRDGLAACPRRPSFYVSAGAHDSFPKAAHAVGLGRSACRKVAVDSAFRLDLDALAAQIALDRAAGLEPCFLAATVGTTACGALDSLAGAAKLCARENLWLHVDGAWGSAWALVPEMRAHFAGIERADSLTLDAHKALQVPMGAGMLFCRHPESVRRAFRTATDYMPSGTAVTDDPYSSTMQWSRRAIGLKLFVALASLGLPGAIEMLREMARRGDALREKLAAAGWEIVAPTPLPLVCFTRASLGTDETAVRAAADGVIASGAAWIAPIRAPDGRWLLRACITSHLTSNADLDVLVTALA